MSQDIFYIITVQKSDTEQTPQKRFQKKLYKTLKLLFINN